MSATDSSYTRIQQQYHRYNITPRTYVAVTWCCIVWYEILAACLFFLPIAAVWVELRMHLSILRTSTRVLPCHGRCNIPVDTRITTSQHARLDVLRVLVLGTRCPHHTQQSEVALMRLHAQDNNTPYLEVGLISEPVFPKTREAYSYLVPLTCTTNVMALGRCTRSRYLSVRRIPRRFFFSLSLPVVENIGFEVRPRGVCYLITRVILERCTWYYSSSLQQ